MPRERKKIDDVTCDHFSYEHSNQNITKYSLNLDSFSRQKLFSKLKDDEINVNNNNNSNEPLITTELFLEIWFQFEGEEKIVQFYHNLIFLVKLLLQYTEVAIALNEEMKIHKGNEH